MHLFLALSLQSELQGGTMAAPVGRTPQGEFMLRRIIVSVLVLLVAPQTATLNAQAGDLSPADIAAIRATSDLWMAAVRAGRAEGTAATFTEDATLWLAGTPYVGRDAIRKFHQAMPPFDPTRNLHLDEIRGRGDIAFVAGHSTIIPAGGSAPVVVGRYRDVRRRQRDGTWLFYRGMVTPVTPPATAR